MFLGHDQLATGSCPPTAEHREFTGKDQIPLLSFLPIISTDLQGCLARSIFQELLHWEMHS